MIDSLFVVPLMIRDLLDTRKSRSIVETIRACDSTVNVSYFLILGAVQLISVRFIAFDIDAFSMAIVSDTLRLSRV